jgi:hypothetical protein
MPMTANQFTGINDRLPVTCRAVDGIGSALTRLNDGSIGADSVRATPIDLSRGIAVDVTVDVDIGRKMVQPSDRADMLASGTSRQAVNTTKSSHARAAA